MLFKIYVTISDRIHCEQVVAMAKLEFHKFFCFFEISLFDSGELFGHGVKQKGVFAWKKKIILVFIEHTMFEPRSNPI